MSQKIIFSISNGKSFFILVPPDHLKATWYTKPSKKLNKFDEIFFVYETEIICIFLANDEELHIVLDILITALKKCLNDTKELELQKPAQCGNLGIYFNNNAMKDDHRYDFSRYWLFSTKEIQTWIYTLNNEIYIEISNSWRWLYLEPDLSDPNFISYDEFMKNYKPIAVEKISEETAQKWLEQCNRLMKKIE
jgi:hypothetical protein